MSTAEPARLLIVDDEPAQVTTLMRALQNRGFALTGVHSATEALSALRAERFDVVLTDLMMPDMDGVELLRAAQQLDPDLVGIVMTGHGTIDTAVEAMKSGALDYILKPFNLGTILPVLSRALTVRRLRVENALLLQRVAERNAELEKMNRELRSVHRELEAFTSTVSHDLRRPLHAMVGFSELLLSETPGPLNTKQKGYIREIHGSGQRLFELTDVLLRFARLGRQALSTQQVDVSALVRSVVTELNTSEGRRSVDIRIGALPNVSADASLLKQVFSNLLSNAMKFTRPCNHPIVEVSGWLEDRDCVYCVRDNGVGFDMGKADNLFGLFQRLPGSERFEGNGVGLSISQRIIERHGGRISAEAHVGEGARFTFTLPQ